MVKINIAYPKNGSQKVLDIDERKLSAFWERRLGTEIAGAAFNEDFKGYVFKITGGNDKEGFPMVQGIMTNQRVRLMLAKGAKYYRPRRQGERKRKSVRGCIVDRDMSVINLVVLKEGAKPIEGLTGTPKDKRLGPKRATTYRKLFNLAKQDNIFDYVVRRTVPSKKAGKKPHTRMPKIQRLITPQALQRKRHRITLRRERYAAGITAEKEYSRLLSRRRAELMGMKPRGTSAPSTKSTSAASASPATTATAKPATATATAATPAKKDTPKAATAAATATGTKKTTSSPASGAAKGSSTSKPSSSSSSSSSKPAKGSSGSVGHKTSSASKPASSTSAPAPASAAPATSGAPPATATTTATAAAAGKK